MHEYSRIDNKIAPNPCQGCEAKYKLRDLWLAKDGSAIVKVDYTFTAVGMLWTVDLDDWFIFRQST